MRRRARKCCGAIVWVGPVTEDWVNVELVDASVDWGVCRKTLDRDGSSNLSRFSNVLRREFWLAEAPISASKDEKRDGGKPERSFAVSDMHWSVADRGDDGATEGIDERKSWSSSYNKLQEHEGWELLIYWHSTRAFSSRFLRSNGTEDTLDLTKVFWIWSYKWFDSILDF
jgi:hypothetical protein